MGLCSSLEARSFAFGERKSFVFYQRSPANRNNSFEISFVFDDNLSTMSSLASQQPQKHVNGNKYEIWIKKHQEQIETSLGDIGSEIENAFQAAEANGFKKIVFIEPFAETQKNLKLIFSEIVRMLFSFDHELKFPSVSKVYLSWPSLNCREAIAKVVEELTILK